ncbi:hypothetical protein [Gilvibacter sediminis]|uniref:hypothetical protein n=1 Tax=Gilvibacter sediminis TaxID=379071 RepID=UPI002350939B|nr:hypothetical protein [Gilvibacter sediminis]MDC7997426.1 hypothetical protein [Gilvibacter sediminis]
MKLTKRVLLYAMTVVVTIGAFIWNNRVEQWMATQDDPEMVVRTDLLVLYPLVLTLIAISAYSLYKDYKQRNS